MTRRRLKESKPSNHWIGARLAKLRRMRGLTQQDVGNILSRTDSAVSDIENGYSDITLVHLLNLAQGMGVPAAGLLLPDPGATTHAPFEGNSGTVHSAVIDLLTHEKKVQLLSKILENLSSLSVEQLSDLARSTEQAAERRSSAA